MSQTWHGLPRVQVPVLLLNRNLLLFILKVNNNNNNNNNGLTRVFVNSL